MARSASSRAGSTALPEWIRPQLTELVDAAPEGPDWLHEIKFDGYRMHARLDRGAVKLLTRTGLDWTHKYPAIAAGGVVAWCPPGLSRRRAVRRRPRRHHLVQHDPGRVRRAATPPALVFFLFDLLYLDGEIISARPLIERKARLAALLSQAGSPPALQRSPDRARPGFP